MHLHDCPFFLMGLVLVILTQPSWPKPTWLWCRTSAHGPKTNGYGTSLTEAWTLKACKKPCAICMHTPRRLLHLMALTSLQTLGGGSRPTSNWLKPSFLVLPHPPFLWVRTTGCPSRTPNNATPLTKNMAARKSLFSGFKFIETWRYTSEGGFIKQIRRMFPMESFVSGAPQADQSLLISAMGVCDCGSRPPSKVKPSRISFKHDVVVDVPFEDRPDPSTNMAALNMVRMLLSDVGSGKLAVLDYAPLGDIVPAAQERVHTPFTVHVYDEFGDVVGSRDTVFVTPRIGDEFGKELNTTQLHDKLHFHHLLNVYDDWGEVIGTKTVKHPISASNIRGLRFYETWHFLEKNPCPVKKSNMSFHWSAIGTRMAISLASLRLPSPLGCLE